MKKTAKRPAGRLVNLASRIFGTPLAIEPRKLSAILTALGSRLGIDPHADLGEVMDTGDAERRPYSVSARGVAIVDVIGTLAHRGAGINAMSGLTTYQEISAEIDQALGDHDVKGILLLIDSPGGEVAGMFDLATKIRSASARKPVVSLAQDMACSAAYLIASAAPTALISQSGLMGSIGIVLAHTDTTAADAMSGVKVSYVHAGARKADGSTSLDHEHRAAGTALQAEVDRYAEMFYAAVADFRGLTADVVKSLQAGVLVGEDAVSAGLADDVADLDYAESCVCGEEPAPSQKEMTAVRGPLLAPFGPYDDFADCVNKNRDKDDPEAYCGKIKHEVEGTSAAVQLSASDEAALDDEIVRIRTASRLPEKARQGPEQELGMAEIKKDLSPVEQLLALRAEGERLRAELVESRAEVASLRSAISASEDAKRSEVIKRHMDRGAVVPASLGAVQDLAKIKSAEELDRALAAWPVVLRKVAVGSSADAAPDASGAQTPLERLKAIAADEKISFAEACERNPSIYREHRISNPLGQRSV